jgi:dTDP-4-amino-4,6-dideoxygalactose transaminase
MADMDALRRIAEKHDIALIEDCAHTHGSKWRGSHAGTLGTLGSFSFQRSKLMNGAEGGALLTQDEDLYWKIVSQRSCGREIQPGVKVHSGNYRMTGFQAAILRGQLAALEANAPVMDGNGRALDRAVAEAPGVHPLRRDEQITRQCSYGFVFRFDADAFDGLDVATFRQALAAELGIAFHTTYAPLNQSEVYYPHTKKRHQLSPEYVEAITPARWDLPVAEDLWRNQVVMAHWHILGCPVARAALLTDAIAKIYEARDVLLAETVA